MLVYVSTIDKDILRGVHCIKMVHLCHIETIALAQCIKAILVMKQ